MKIIFAIISVVFWGSYNCSQKDKTGTHDLIFFQDANGKYALKDRKGKVIEESDEGAVSSFSEGLSVVELNGRVGFIDSTRKVVIRLEYDHTGKFSERLAEVKIGKEIND